MYGTLLLLVILIALSVFGLVALEVAARRSPEGKPQAARPKRRLR
ncbi:hypothetical protein Bra471DRAFT_02595 [Bradyrhizobium sp. WSM471]|jgi:hypothetical protein|nr:hypothetical protein Bra471DRAFT_02595 [Bradyrhizobium sp. WSM471]